MRNYYEALGVSEKATQDEIKSAYRKLAKQHHPDAGGDESKFKEISEAYDHLKDEKRRKEYDIQRQYGDGNPFQSHPGRRGGGSPFGGGFGDFVDLNDIFSGAFREMHRRNPDTISQIFIDLETAFYGKDITVNLTGTNKSVDISIPPGIQDGAKIRIPNAGRQQYQDMQAGDYILQVRIAPHDRFIKNGNNLIYRLDLDAIECILGTEKEVRSIDNKNLKVKIPAGTQPGRKLKLTNHGMPHKQGRGDLIVEVNVIIPKNITDEQRDILEKFKNASK